MKNVSARYVENQPLVLRNISFKINSGENIGIIGPTGSGKSSLFFLLTKNLDLADSE